MELVSANTKNYLFLTLSQYNDLPKLVRARVSMRRDQPFWEGGNSFIACESFRVSTSPSQGGLYYNRIPSTFYMGCSVDTSPQDDEKDPQALHHDTSGSDSSVDTLQARNIQRDDLSMYATMQLGLSTLDPRETLQSRILGRLGRYFNQNVVTQGSTIRIYDGNLTTTWWEGTLQEAPSQTMQGTGVGVGQLFQPRFLIDDFATVAAAFAADPDAVQQIIVYAIGKNQATDEFKADVVKLISRGLYLETILKSDHGENSKWHDPPGLGPVIQILGPSSFTCNIPDVAPDGTLVDAIQWSEIMPLGPGTPIIAIKNGKQVNGQCRTVDPSWIGTDKDGVRLNLAIKFTDAAKTDAAKASLSVPLQMSAALQCTTSSMPYPTQCGSNVTMFITNWLPKTGDTENVPPVFTSSFSASVRLPKKDKENRTSKFDLIRRATTDPNNAKYVYTPNEFFYLFNRPESGIKAMPFVLNTDENGGFVVDWAPSASDPNKLFYHDFVISKAMVDSLGLNEYMTYELQQGVQDQHIDPGTGLVSAFEIWECTVQTFATSDDGIFEDHTFAEATFTINSRELVEPDGSVFVPPDYLPDTDFQQEVMIKDTGQSVYLLAIKKKRYDRRESHPSKIYPVLMTDQHGGQFYKYENLPPEARLGNTQQVSVESWSTYSQIDIVIPNLPFQPMLGSETDARILASLRLPFVYSTTNAISGHVSATGFSYYGDLLFNSDSSRSYLKITTDQQLYDCDIEARLIRRDGQMDHLTLPYKGQFQVKLRFLQTQ